MNPIIFKRILTFNALLTLFVLFASFYFQYVQALMPCPLCIMQRVCVFLLLAVMCFNFRTLRRAHTISWFLIGISCAGLFFSVRQLWLQSLPAGQAPACMPGLDILIRYFPWQAVLKALLWGSGDCAEVNWRMLGISMPGWSALYFLFMVLMALFLLWHTRAGKLSMT